MKTRPANDYCVVLSTASDLTEAHRIADALIEANLAACVQLSQISSVYRWGGTTETNGEVRLFIKSRRDLFPQIAATVGEHHSYDTPQVLMMDCVEGAAAYLDWIDESTAAANGR